MDFGNSVGLFSYYKKKMFCHLITGKQSVVWIIFKKKKHCPSEAESITVKEFTTLPLWGYVLVSRLSLKLTRTMGRKMWKREDKRRTEDIHIFNLRKRKRLRHGMTKGERPEPWVYTGMRKKFGELTVFSKNFRVGGEWKKRWRNNFKDFY